MESQSGPSNSEPPTPAWVRFWLGPTCRRDHREIHTALCVDDRCPWKYRGLTTAATTQAALAHYDETGHPSRIYYEASHVIERRR
jgi:hypothetical protein